MAVPGRTADRVSKHKALLAAAFLVVAGLGSGRATPQPLAHTLTNVRAGVSVAYPGGWDATARPLTAVVSPAPVFAVASYPLRGIARDPTCAPRVALRRLPLDGVFIYAFDTGSGAVGEFPPRPIHFSMRDLRRGGAECFGSGYTLRFRERQRWISLALRFGAHTSPRTKARALAVLDSIRFLPRHTP